MAGLVRSGDLFSGAGLDRGPRTQQVAAGYTVYGPSTMLILTVGSGVHAFTLDRELGSFVLTQRDMKIPEDTKEYSINASNERFWEPPVQRYITELKAGKEGRLFGAVKPVDVAEAVKAAGLGDLDKRKIHITSPIKAVGEHEATVRLRDDLTAVITLQVVAAK